MAEFTVTVTVRAGNKQTDLPVLKKDGTLDMRYKSSKAVAKALGLTKVPTKTAPTIIIDELCDACLSRAVQCGELHRKKDGSLDMRFKSSKKVAAQLKA